MDSEKIFCSNCNTKLISLEEQCFNCGDTNKVIHLSLEDGLTTYDQIKGKVKDKTKIGKKKYIQEFISGFEQSKNGEWVEKERVINREANVYVEKIIKEDGSILRDYAEPLKDHKGHGSAKFDK